MDVYLAKGTRDFLPEQMHNRLQVIETLRSVFTRYGFEPLATPAFERIETLTGKYNKEGDKLIFKILKRGEGGECSSDPVTWPASPARDAPAAPVSSNAVSCLRQPWYT